MGNGGNAGSVGTLGQRVAVISGGGSRIGREIALELARRGHPLALLGRRSEPLAAVLSEAGGEGLALVCDVSDAAAVDSAAREIEARFGAAGVLVPAAGVATIGPLESIEPERFAAMLDTNVRGTFHLLRSFLPAMRAQGAGRIFPVLSMAAREAFPGWSGYCASKWAVDGLITALRGELQGSGVLVTALFPGATDTAIWDDLPGSWNRAAMVPAREIARAVGFALDADPAALVEEIKIGPAGGAL